MDDKPTDLDESQELPPGVPRPPSKGDLAQISQAQALIGDEWGDNPPPTDKPVSDPLG